MMVLTMVMVVMVMTTMMQMTMRAKMTMMMMNVGAIWAGMGSTALRSTGVKLPPPLKPPLSSATLKHLSSNLKLSTLKPPQMHYLHHIIAFW